MRSSSPGWITYGVLLALSLLLFAAVLLPVWKPLLVAAVLAGGLGPLHDRLARRLRGHRGLAAALLVVGVILLLLVPIAIMLAVLIPQILEGVSWVTHELGTGGVNALIEHAPASLRGYLTQAI